jgi:uncharacterized membrane protein YccC
VNNARWVDQNQPQTLYVATILLYVNAAFWVLDLLLGSVWPALLALLAVGAVFAGLGIANEKKAGYWGALAVATVNLVLSILYFHYASGSIGIIMNLLFAMALFALLVHPMTRSYQRIWFRKLNRR